MDSILKLFIGLAAVLVWYVLSKNKGDKEPVGALWIAGGFGVLAIVLSIALEYLLLPDDGLSTKTLPLHEAWRVSLIIGAIEEVCKFVPLALFLYKKRYFNEYNDGILYFALAGLGFGVPENVLYTLSGGVLAGVVRLVMTPFFHAATTAVVGYFLVRTKIERKNVATVLLALLGAIVVHAVYDFGLFYAHWQSVLLSLAISISLTALLVGVIQIAVYQDERLMRTKAAVASPQPFPAVQPQVYQSAPAFAAPVAPTASYPPSYALAPAPPQPPQSTGAIIALVCGVSSIVFLLVPVAGVILGVPAVVFGILARKQAAGMAVAGLVTGIAGVLLSTIWTLICATLLISG